MKKIIIGYGISLALVVCYLVFFEFSFHVFLPALVFTFSCWFNIDYYISKNKTAGLMWLLSIFGLFGVIASLLSVAYTGYTCYFIGVLSACIICSILQSFAEKILDFIKGNKVYSYRSDFPASIITMCFTCCVCISDIIRYNIAQMECLDKQMKEEKFVPVKFRCQEINSGNTVYFYEAKGKMFFIHPNEFPEIRKAGKNFEAKVILKDYPSTGYGAYGIERFELKK